MKKYPVGLRPFNARLTGWGLLVIGVVGIILKAINYFTNKIYISDFAFFVSLGILIASLYLLFIAPKNY